MSLKSVRQQVTNGFLSLRGCLWQLYLIYVLKFLESFNYFSLSVTFTLYLSEDFGISDLEAGSIYGLWGTLLTAYGFALGPIIDWLGVRGSLMLCFALGTASRAVVALTTTRWVLYAALLGPLTVAESLGIPVMTIAVKRFTKESNRGFAFSLFYTIMNIAALLNGLLFDVFRKVLRTGPDLRDGGGGSTAAGGVGAWMLSDAYRMYLMTGCLTSAAGLAVACFVTDPLKAAQAAAAAAARRAPGAAPGIAGGDTDEGVPLLAGSPRIGGDGAAASRLSVRRLLKRSASVFEGVDGGELLKYCAMCVLSVNLKTIFRHMEATLPKYLIRSFGCDAPVGLIYAINPALILLLVPLAGALLQSRLRPFDAILYGGYVSALSPLWLAAFDALWAAVPFVAMLSIGEAVWSPRWYDYSMAVAPEGKEGLFTACGSAPLFLATLPTGMLSGVLLSVFCPSGPMCDAAAPADLSAAGCDGHALWGVVTATTLLSPLLITAFRGWLRPKPAVPGTPLDFLDYEDDPHPDLLPAPVVEQDQRLEFGEVEAEFREAGTIAAVHGHGSRQIA